MSTQVHRNVCNPSLALVRSFALEPATLYVLSGGGGRYEVSRNKDALRGLSLPEVDVFSFSENLKQALETAHREGDNQTLQLLWSDATLFHEIQDMSCSKDHDMVLSDHAEEETKESDSGSPARSNGE